MEWLPQSTTDGNAPTSRKGHTITRLLNSPMLLLFGGDIDRSTGIASPTNEMYCYHTDRNYWRKIIYAEGSVPVARMLHTATAISAHLMVVFGGEVSTGSDERDNSFTATNETWVFDIRDCTWREIKLQDNTPSKRSCHSAVLGHVYGQVPAMYVFGGFGANTKSNDITYRLRVGDWRWERLPIHFRDTNDVEKSVYNLKELGSLEYVNQDIIENTFPVERQSHAAIWVPRLRGMLIIGGDAGTKLLDDTWLLSLSTKGTWRWKQVILRKAREQIENEIPYLAGHTITQLPTDTLQFLIWGGMEGEDGKNFMSSEKAYLLDLSLMQSTLLPCKGKIEQGGRVLHGSVIMNNQIIMFGGCREDESMIEGVTIVKLRPDVVSFGSKDVHFGAHAVCAAAGQPIKYNDNGDPVNEDDLEEETNQKPMENKNIPLVSSSDIPKGTPITGKVIETTEDAYFVSVEINGRLYKGVLTEKQLLENKFSNQEEQTPKKEKDEMMEDIPKETPPPKKPRYDPIADMLPDEQPTKSTAGNVNENEVIELE